MRTKADANVPWLSKVAAEKKNPPRFCGEIPVGVEQKHEGGYIPKMYINTVDGRNPAPLGIYKTRKQWDKLPINWCRISSGNSNTWCGYLFPFLSCRIIPCHCLAIFLHWNGRKETWSLSLCRVSGQSAYGAWPRHDAGSSWSQDFWHLLNQKKKADVHQTNHHE